MDDTDERAEEAPPPEATDKPRRRGRRAAEKPPNGRRADRDERTPPPRDTPRDTAPESSLSAVLKKHTAKPDHDTSAVEAIAHEAEIGRADGAVPIEESNPHYRRQSTLEVADLAGTEYRPRNLSDLMAHAPLDTATRQYYISVDRKQPRVYNGMPCRGMQARLYEALDDDGFIARYGGGEYELVLYGPPPSGQGIWNPQTLRLMEKPLTPPIRYTVPLGRAAPIVEYPDDDQEESEMRAIPPPLMGRRPNTPADANIYKATLDHEERIDDKREERERARLERRESERRQEERDRFEMAKLVASTKEQELERIEREHARERARIEQDHKERMSLVDQVRSTNDPNQMLTGVAALLKAVQPNQPAAATIEAQLRQISDGHRAETERLHQAQREYSERMEVRIKDIERRADDRILEAERRADDRIKSVEQKAEERRSRGAVAKSHR
jgi:hypothetical protein